MADNVTVTSGTGVTVASDQGGSGEQYQWVKLKYGANGSFVDITTASGFPVQILSMPALGFGGLVSISNLSITISNLATTPLTISGTTIAIVGIVSVTNHGITSLPALGFGGLVSISNLSITVSNLSTVPLTVSGTTIAITSLPALGFGGLVSISNLSITVSNLSTVPLTISGTTIAITSLPNLGVGSILSINNLTVNPSINSTIGNFPVEIIPQKSMWRFTATQTAAGTLLVKALVASQTAIYISNVIVSNENTAGNIRFIESTSNVAIRPVIERLYLAVNGGAVMPFTHPIACDTNCALYVISTTVANYSVTVAGFTAPISTSL